MAVERDIATISTGPGDSPAAAGDSLSAQWIESARGLRRDISRYLHDTLAQDLVVLSFALEKLRFAPHFKASAEFDHALGMLDQCCQDLRVLNLSLFTPALDGSLAAVLQRYIERLHAEAGLKVEFTGENTGFPTQEVCAFFLEAIQVWAGKAIAGQPQSVPARIELAETPVRMQLALTSDRSDDPAILAVSNSVFLAHRAKELGGSIEVLSSREGALTRISVSVAARK